MKKLSALAGMIILAFFSIQAFAVNYYWVGGTGNWSEFATHWATSSGGGMFHLQAPTENDDVYFDANSFTGPLQSVNIDVFNATCRDMNWTGASNNPTLVFMNSITIYGSLTFIPGMSCTMTSGLYLSTNSPATSIDFGGINLPMMQLHFQSGSTGTWTLQSDMNMTDMNAMIMFNDGNLNTNGYTINTNNINVMGSAHGSWTLGNSTINCSSFSLMGSPATCAIDAGTSTINIINGNSSFMGNGYTFYNMNFDGLSMGTSLSLNGNMTFEVLSFNNIATVLFPQNGTTTVTDVQFNGSCANVVTVSSATSGYTSYIFKANGTVNEDYLAIKDITVLGGGVFTSNNSSDLGNVNNWTINAAVSNTLYWIGGTGDWNDPVHWSLSSGGPQAGACAPTVNDDVIFDANSFSAAGQVVSIDGNAFCHDMTWTGVTNNPDLDAFNFWGDNLFIGGTMLLDPGMTVSFNGAYNFVSDDAGEQINTQNIPLPGNVFFSGSGEWTLAGNFQCAYLYVNQGSFITNNHDLTATSFTSSSTLVRSINLGSSLITLSNSWQIQNTANLTFTAGTSSIGFSANATFQGGNQAYCNVGFAGNAGIYDNNTFINIGFQTGTTVSFEAGSTQTILNMIGANGTCGNYIIIQSLTEGTQATIAKAIGNVTVDYCRIKDINAIGGATFTATNSTDMGNNTGWVIASPAATTYYWVGGTGNWNDPAHWATSSGGAADACIPAWSDNVVFDGGSGLPGQTVTVNVTSGCNNFTWSVPNATLAGTSYDLYVGGSFTLNAAMNMNFGSNNNSIIFYSDNPGNLINFAGKTIYSNIEFNGSGSWILAGTMNCFRSIYIHKGNLNLNNNIMICSSFNSNTSEIRQLSLGTQTHTISSGWYLQDGTNFTMIAGTSTLNIAGAYFYGGDKTYNIVNLTTSGFCHIRGGNTFATLNIPSSRNVSLEGGKIQTVASLTILSGVDCNNYNNLYSNIPGTPATITKNGAAVNLNFMNISDVRAAGTAICTANNSIGIGDVTGWIINPPAGVTHYWVGGSGDWTDNLHWSAASGGPGGLCVPTTLDDVIFDANSFIAPATVNMNTTGYCKSMDWTGAGFNPLFQMNGNLNVNGSLTFIPAMDIYTYSSVKFISAAPANTVTTAGKELYYIYFDGSGTYTLQDDISFNYIYFNNGILNTNDVALYGGSNGTFTSNSISARTLNLSSSSIEVYSWDISDPTNMTLNAGTSNILLINNPWIFRGGDLPYYNLTITPGSFGGYTTVYGSNSFNMLKLNPGCDLRLESGETQTTLPCDAVGDPGNTILLSAATNGSFSSITQAPLPFCGDYLDILDMHVAGTTFYAGNNSSDLGGNLGWTWSGLVVIDQYPAPMCEDVAGGGTVAGVDLTSWNAAIDGGTGSTHTWYSDATLTTLVPVPTNVTVNDGLTFWDLVDNGTCSEVAQIVFTVVDLPVLSFIVTDVLCNGDNTGAIDMTVTGGAAPYTIGWSTGASTEDISSLTANSYTVTVTDVNSCGATDGATVSEPVALSVDSESSLNATCNGSCDGAVLVTASGGTPPLTYDIGSGPQANGTFLGLCPTIIPCPPYQVTITDANGCTITSSAITITQPPALSIDSESATDALCPGDCNGTVTVTVSGGTGVLSYDIGAGAQANGNFINLCAGSYQVTITDVNGCTVTSSNLTVNEPPPFSITAITSDITCNGDCDGSIDLTVSGGTPPYNVLWSNGATTTDISGLCNGSYTVTITDANGCTAVAGPWMMTDPPALSIDTEGSTNIDCNGDGDGTVTVTASGGTGILSYDIGSGAQATGDFTGLNGGTYTVTVTDANGCTAESSALVVNEPSAISIDSENYTDITCNGDNDGTITVTASGGTGALSYDLGAGAQATGDFTNIAGGTYTVTVTDANGCTAESGNFTITDPAALSIDSEGYTDITCNGANDGTVTITASGGTGALSYDIGSGAQGTGAFTGLGVGLYTVTVTDANGCFINSSAFNITQPAALSIVSEGATDITCNGDNDGTITIIAAGGTPPLSYDLGSGPQANGSFTALSGGTYTVTVTDNNSCTVESSALTVNEPAAISIDSEAYTDVQCNGTNDGTITVTASGGTGALSYNLGTGPHATGDFTGLDGGTFTVTVTDANGCTAQSSALIITEPSAIALSETHSDVTSCGGNDGSIDLTTGGGTPGYTYAWTGPAGFSAGTEDINTLIAGSYTVVVTDANLCVDSLTIGISEAGAPTITIESQVNVLCHGDCTGSAAISASGGTAPYTYLWSTGGTDTLEV
ncbi:MAG: SprB repeat-containing protein, partial [Bacteroidota bacterium]